jgi:hypothetical protein
MHLVTFADEVKSLLGKSDDMAADVDLSALKFADGAKEKVRFSFLSSKLIPNFDLFHY